MIVRRGNVLAIFIVLCSLSADANTDTYTHPAELVYKHAVLGCVGIPGGPVCVIQLSDLSDLKCHLLCHLPNTCEPVGS